MVARPPRTRSRRCRTRSAIFAPIENLGLIIVDEEQESSLQAGRSSALSRSRYRRLPRPLEGAVVLLGSAILRLRPTTTRVPKNTACSRWLRVSRTASRRSSHCRSARGIPPAAPRRACVGSVAHRHRAASRRRHAGNGAHQSARYSWSMLCRSCGSVVQCQNCSIALTYHRAASASNATTAAIRLGRPRPAEMPCGVSVFCGRRRRTRR